MKAFMFAAALAAAALAPLARAELQGAPFALIDDPYQAAAATRVTRDDFKKQVKFEGANASSNNSLYLRGWRDERAGTTTFQIFATSFYGTEWRHYNDAYDSDGNRFDFESISKKVDSCLGARGCYYEEAVGLNVSRKYLEDHQETGIRYKISGKVGESTGFLPAAYVKGFLMSVDRVG